MCETLSSVLKVVENWAGVKSLGNLHLDKNPEHDGKFKANQAEKKSLLEVTITY